MKKHETLMRQAEIARVRTGSWWAGFWTGLLIPCAALAAIWLVLR